MFTITVTDSHGTREYRFESETDAKREFNRIKRAQRTSMYRTAKVTLASEVAA